MKELDFQRAIIQIINSNDGFAMKLSHRFMIGVPDLLISHKSIGTVILESKMVKEPKNMTTKVPMWPTAMQIRTLKLLDESGTKCGLIVGVQNGNSVYAFLMKGTPRASSPSFEELFQECKESRGSIALLDFPFGPNKTKAVTNSFLGGIEHLFTD